MPVWLNQCGFIIPALTLLTSFLFVSCAGGSLAAVDRYIGVYERPTVLECNSATVEITKADSIGSYDSTLADRLIHVQGTSLWCANREMGERGAVNVGEIDFVAPVINGVARYDDTYEDGKIYRIVIYFANRRMVLREEFPNGWFAVHGLNVSFEGEYELR